MRDLRQRVEESTPTIKKFAISIFIDEMPSPKETATCKVHGQFEFRYTDSVIGGKYMQSSSCVKCIDERNIFIESEIKRLSIEEKEEALKLEILDRGVSKRNLTKTFNTFISETPSQDKAKALHKAFADSVCNGSTATNLIVCGSVGTGKTHLASAAVNQITRNKKSCEIIKIIDLIREFKASWSKDTSTTEAGLLKYYTNINALIIDEVGVQFGSDTEKMIIFDIIDGRYNNMLPTALISNLAYPDVKELIGERAIDRMREDGGAVVAMKWDSHRGKQS